MNCGETAGGERIRLILADDARQLLELEKSFFPEDEFEVTLAHNGCEAYNLVKVIEPAVVFLDLFMPMLNGEECCRLIKSDPRLRDIRVVLVATDEERQVRRCRDAQCDLVLIKPIRRRDFISAVQSLIGPVRRAPVRWPMRIAAELLDSQGCCLQTWSVNLSNEGAYLEGTEMPPLGWQYTLRLKTGGDAPFAVPVRIAWHNAGQAPHDAGLPSGFGVQFADLDGEARQQLRKLIDDLTETGGMPRPNWNGAPRIFVELPMLAGKVV